MAAKAGAGRPKLPEEIRLVSYPALLYFWPTLLLSAVCGLLDFVGLHAPVVYGFVFLVGLLVPVATMGVDIPRNVAIIILLTLSLIGMALWMFGIYSLPLAWLWDAAVWLMPRFEYHLGFGVAAFGGLIYAVMLFCARLDSRWEIGPNQFEHFSWGRSDKSIAHGAKTVRADFRDVLELLLGFGGGDLVIYDTRGSSEIERIPNIPFLAWRKDLILEYLEVIRTRNKAGVFDEGEEEEQ